MQLTFINASPRGTKSNTGILTEHFLRGFLETPGNTCDIEYLIKYRKDLKTLTEKFCAAQNVLLGFPLYIDAMPAGVKAFMEALAPLAGQKNLPALGFMIQCGFPETAHLRFIARYCEKFSRRLGCRSLGFILKGGCEGLAIQPSFLTEKYFSLFAMLGQNFAKTGTLDETLLAKLARPEHLTAENLAQVIPFINRVLWDARLKENGVLDQSFARPLMP
ncbi:MAG TPA: NAD(P)H-dependent oxidoreductase [Smithellaceae bacterium]|nr:NAD(P)H-dependent oxidoreductase [Smithellaceae bacterium]